MIGFIVNHIHITIVKTKLFFLVEFNNNYSDFLESRLQDVEKFSPSS